MTVTRTHTYIDGETLTAALLNNEFNNLLNAPAIMNSDVASNAAIALSKLAGSAQGAVPYDNGSSLSTLAAGTSGQFLQTQGAGQNPVWASVTTGAKSAYNETLVNSAFGGSYATVASATISLSASSTVFIIATCDVRENSGDTAQFQILDGASALTSNGTLTGVGGNSTQRYTNTTSYAGTLSSGSHTINYQGKNQSSGNTISVGQTQITVVAIPG